MNSEQRAANSGAECREQKKDGDFKYASLRLAASSLQLLR